MIAKSAITNITKSVNTLGQYIFFGGIERLISLRRRATAAAFFRLRFAVGVSYAIRARSSLSRPVLSIERRKRRNATSTGSFSFGITVVKFFPGSEARVRCRGVLVMGRRDTIRFEILNERRERLR